MSVNCWIDYTPAEWAAIDSAIAEAAKYCPSITATRPNGLLPEDRFILLRRLETYLIALRIAEDLAPVTARDYKCSRRIAWLCDDLSSAIGQVTEAEMWALTHRMCERYLPQLHEWVHHLDSIFQRQRGASVAAGHPRYRSMQRSVVHVLTPVGRYYAGILHDWAHIGGKFRSPHDRRALFNFFSAVAAPVLGIAALENESPSHLSTLYKITKPREIRRRVPVRHLFVLPDRDYTPAEWAAIDSAIAEAKRKYVRVKERRPGGLLSEDRSELRTFRDYFRNTMALARTPTSQIADKKIIRRIGWLCGEISRTIAQISGRARSQMLSDVGKTISLLEELMTLEAKRALTVLSAMREFTSEQSEPRRGLRLKFWSTPKGFLYFQIIAFWVKIGGELRFQRDKATQRLGGPLLDFMEAVANPILCNRALKRESLRDVIELMRL